MRGYARLRKVRGLSGTTLRAVQKAIQDERIREAVGEDGLIDPELADRLWAERTRPAGMPAMATEGRAGRAAAAEAPDPAWRRDASPERAHELDQALRRATEACAGYGCEECAADLITETGAGS